MLAPWAQEQALKYLFTASALGTRPTAWYVALHTGDPGTGLDNEVTGGVDSAYARQSVTFAASQDGDDWLVDSAGAVAFDPAGAGANYTVTHVSVNDASTAGNALVTIQLPVPIPVVENGVVSIPIGQLLVEGGV